MKVSEIMTRDVISVRESDSVLQAAQMLADHDLDGLPVVDAAGTLVGIVTQTDLATKKSHVHIPTLLALLQKFDLYRKDRKFVAKQLADIEALKVADVMNTEPPLLYEGATTDEAVMHLSRTHGVNPTSIVTKNRVLVGVLTRYDIMKQYDSGATPGHVTAAATSKIDPRVDRFLSNFAANYLFVSRARTKAWLITNIVFLVLGAIAAVVLFW